MHMFPKMFWVGFPFRSASHQTFSPSSFVGVWRRTEFILNWQSSFRPTCVCAKMPISFTRHHHQCKNCLWSGLPSGPLGRNRPVNGEDMSLSPGPGRPHMPWGNYASSAIKTEAGCLRACAPQQQSSLCSPQIEKAGEQQQRPSAAQK